MDLWRKRQEGTSSIQHQIVEEWAMQARNHTATEWPGVVVQKCTERDNTAVEMTEFRKGAECWDDWGGGGVYRKGE